MVSNDDDVDVVRVCTPSVCLGMESLAMFQLFGPAAVEDPVVAEIAARCKSDIKPVGVDHCSQGHHTCAAQVGPCIPPKDTGMLPNIKEAIEGEYGTKAGPVIRAAKANACVVLHA